MAKKKNGGMSMMEAVRQTLAAGVDKPTAGIAHIKEKFGLDIPAGIFSSYKSQIGKAAGKKPGKRGRKPGRPAGSGPATPAASTNGGHGVSIRLARDVKKLVEEYGSDAVKGMADVFAGT